jgi:hypothetical protein
MNHEAMLCAPGYDWPFVAEMFQFYGCWPANLRRKCGTIDWENMRLQHRYNVLERSFRAPASCAGVFPGLMNVGFRNALVYRKVMDALGMSNANKTA